MRLPAKQKEVEEKLKQHNLVFSNFSTSQTFDRRIAELEQLRKKIIFQEEELYRSFGVRDINQLQNKIDKDCQPLFRFASVDLTKYLKLVEQQFGPANYLIQLTPFYQKVIPQLVTTDTDQLSDIAINKIIDEINLESGTTFKKISKGKKLSLGKLLQNLYIKNGKLMIKQEIQSSTLTRHTKKVLDKIVDKSGSRISSNNGITIDLTSQNRQEYGGWGYSWENIKDKPDKQDEIRNAILVKCKQIINDSPCNDAFTQAFQKISTKDLLKNDISGVTGILGEIALSAILIRLGGKSNRILAAGGLRNELSTNRGELGIDVFLGLCGFQVKNYNEFAKDIPNTVVVDKKNKLTTWEEKLDLNDTLSNLLNNFYSIKHFNVQYNEKYAPTTESINQADIELINFYSAFPDKILQLEEDDLVLGANGDAMLSGRFYKTFFFVSGKYLLPSSVIIDRIMLFLKNAQNKEKDTLSDITYKSSYNGPTIEDYKNKKVPSYSSIYNHISLTLGYRFDLQHYFDF